MDDKPKKRGRKVGSKNKVSNNGPPKKRGRKPNEKVIMKENPVFANDSVDIDNLIIKLNNSIDDNNISLNIIDEKYDDNIICNDNNEIVCWNCVHKFQNITIGLPINYNNNIFHTIGEFCSLECMARYALDNYNEEIYNLLPLINLFGNKINNDNEIKKINIAPNKLMLKIFGGKMDINEYRNSNNILYDVKMPIIIPVNYNINKYGVKNNNNFSDLKLYRKKKMNSQKDNILNHININ